VVETFHPQFGWKRFGCVSASRASCVRTLSKDGVTVVALWSTGRTADVRIEELVPTSLPAISQ